MEITVLNTNLEAIGVVDVFESIIWTDRYTECGDFDLRVAPDSIASAMDSYLHIPGSEHTMIIEDLEIHSDVDAGNKLTVKGRSLESILDRRIVWNKTILTGNFQDAILKLLNENAIAPTDTARRITRLVFEASVDPIITALTIDAQYNGYSLYKAITELCYSKNIGFKITMNNHGEFVFTLYSGVDRSYGQDIHPFIVFCPGNDNLTNSDYKENEIALKTITLVGAQGDGAQLITTTVEVTDGAGSDLARRELFTDATSLARPTPTVQEMVSTPTYLTDLNKSGADYVAQLQQKGKEDLSANAVSKIFEGQIDPTVGYTYGTDFFMGDIVQVADIYGHTSKSRVVELINSQDADGVKVYPTFSAIP